MEIFKRGFHAFNGLHHFLKLKMDRMVNYWANIRLHDKITECKITKVEENGWVNIWVFGINVDICQLKTQKLNIDELTIPLNTWLT